METARQIAAFSAPIILAIAAFWLMTTGDGKPLGAAVLAAVLVAFFLVFTQDIGDRNG